jgi:hypothetical protein
VSYEYKVTEKFWENFYALSDSQKASVREKWKIFKDNPFDPILRSHKINVLSAYARHTIYSVVIEANLRVLFRIDENTITSLDVGTHNLYQ